MIRGYGQDKRQREDEQARKRQDKERRRLQKRDASPREVPVEHAAQAPESPSVEDIMRTLGRAGGEDRSAAALPLRLFVGGLSDDVSEADLRAVFGPHGAVADCFIMRDRSSGMPRGFGFVTMADRKDAPRAIAALHGMELKGRSLVINVATARAR